MRSCLQRWPEVALLFNCTVLLVILFSTIPLSEPSGTRSYCLPTGSPSTIALGVGEVTGAQNPLALSYFFTVNVAFGSFSFSTAKLIDILWDTIVGRGGQLLLAYVAYRVSSQYLLYSLQCRIVSYRAFSALSLEQASWFPLKQLYSECYGNGPKTNFQFLCLAFAMTYLLAFPTLMGAMTGYATGWVPFIRQADGTMVLLANYDIVKYIIHDGDRIGLRSDTLVYAEQNFLGETPTYYDASLRTAVEIYVHHYCELGCGDAYPLDATRHHPTLIAVTAPGGSPIISTANVTSTMKPNINYGRQTSGGGVFDWNGKQTNLPVVVLNFTVVELKARHGFLNQTQYSAKDMAANLHCKQSDDYQWGISFLLLFITAWLHTAWVIIMFGIWKAASKSTSDHRVGGLVGKYRAAMDLTKVFKTELGEQEAEAHSECSLEEVINKSTNGLYLTEYGLRVVKRKTRSEGYGRVPTLEKDFAMISPLREFLEE